MMTHLARPLHVILADHFADPGASRHPLRLRLASGEEFDCHAPCFDVNRLVLVVTTSDGVARAIRPDEIQALDERRARWPAYAGLTVATVAMGAGISALLEPLLIHRGLRGPFWSPWWRRGRGRCAVGSSKRHPARVRTTSRTLGLPGVLAHHLAQARRLTSA